MQILTTLDLLYVVLALFTTIIGVLLSLILIRVFKILGVIQEITSYYYSVKKYFSMYSKIPGIIKDKVFEVIGKQK